jgi:hypothetical protein
VNGAPPLSSQEQEELNFLYEEWAHPFFISIQEFCRLMEVGGGALVTHLWHGGLLARVLFCRFLEGRGLMQCAVSCWHGFALCLVQFDAGMGLLSRVCMGVFGHGSP